MKITLFYSPSCPFCSKVLEHIHQHAIPCTLADLSQLPAYKTELLEFGGKAQVPCLKIDDTFLYESDSIIQWLEKNKERLS